MKTLRKIICILLSLIFAVSAFPAAYAVPETGSPNILFNAAGSENILKNSKGCSVSFDEGDRNVFVLATDESPSSEIALENFDDSFGYAVVTYRTPVTNSPAASKMTLEFKNGSEVLGSGSFCYTNGYKSYSGIVDITGLSGADSLKITYFDDMEYGDSVHLYGISFYKTREDAETGAKQSAKEATGEALSRYTETELASDSYVEELYMLPYWDSDVVFNENVYPLLNSDGTIDDITLMYDADRIVNVKSYTLDTEYQEGVDYEIKDGKLRILTDGSIPCVNYNEHYYNYNAPFTYRMINGGYVRFQEGQAICLSELAITYTHTDSWSGYIPKNQGEKLPRTKELLESGSDIDIVFFGDSITNGGNSSVDIEMKPYADRWTTMLEKELCHTYPDAKIHCKNTSVSGGSVETAVENLYNAIINNNPDLLILALGTNDYQFQYSASKVIGEMRYVVDSVKNYCPNAEIIIVSPMLSNPECFSKDLLYEYRQGYADIVNSHSGMALVDVTEIHDYLLTRKSYTDMSANNLCHLNDFFARVYGQSLLKTITAEKASYNFKAQSKSRLDFITSDNLYFENEINQINVIKAAAAAEIDAAETVEEIRKIFFEAQRQICTLPMKREAVESMTDFKNIRFSSSLYNMLLENKHNLSFTYDPSENALALTVTNASDPYVFLKYSNKAPINAGDNKYVVFTYKIPSSNSAKAEGTELYFCSGYSKNAIVTNRIKVETEKDDRYHSVLIDLSSKSWWRGNISQIRIDPFNTSSSGDKMFVHSVALFGSEEEAKKFAQKTENDANGIVTPTYETLIFDNSASVSAFAAPTKAYLAGDADDDGKITAKDSRLLKLYATGHLRSEKTELFDSNGDGTVNALDSAYIKLLIVDKAAPIYFDKTSLDADVSYSEEENAVFAGAGDFGYTFIKNKNELEAPKYTVVVFKDVENEKSTKTLYFGEKISNNFKTTVDIVSTETYNYLIAEISDKELAGNLYFETAESGTYIDSVGYFENYDAALNFAYERTLGRVEPVPSDNIEIIFNNDLFKYFEYLNNTSYEYKGEEDGIKFTVSDNPSDPYVYLNLKDLAFSADEYKYAVYEYKIPTGNSYHSSAGQIFFCAGEYINPSEKSARKLTLSKTGNFEKLLIDLSNESYWKGDVYGIRLDYFQSARLGDACYIKSVTFCKTADEANALIRK